MDSIKNRKTIRKYADRPVDDGLLNMLLEEAERTQTMGNLQLYSVVVTRSQEMKQKLAPAHFNQPMVTNAPVVLTVCADFNRTGIVSKRYDLRPVCVDCEILVYRKGVASCYECKKMSRVTVNLEGVVGVVRVKVNPLNASIVENDGVVLAGDARWRERSGVFEAAAMRGYMVLCRAGCGREHNCC